MTRLMLLLFFLGSCAAAPDERSASECTAEPLQPVMAFVTSDRSLDLRGRVVAIEPMQGITGRRYTIEQESAPAAKLTVTGLDAIPGVRTGATYRFVVEYEMGEPGASALLVYEKERLIFASFSDQRPFASVLRDGVPGFTIEQLEPSCTSRGASDCYTSRINVPIRVSHGSKSVVLHHPDRARLGDYEVQVLTSERISYSPQCADAGLIGVSLTITAVE